MCAGPHALLFSVLVFKAEHYGGGVGGVWGGREGRTAVSVVSIPLFKGNLGPALGARRWRVRDKHVTLNQDWVRLSLLSA